MLITHILYRGEKPDIKELQEIFPTLRITLEPMDKPIRTIVDPYYKIRTLDWSWFRDLFHRDVDIRCLALHKDDLDGVGVKDHWGFYYLNDGDNDHDFYMTNLPYRDARARANGFQTSFTWMFVHEYLHGCVWEKTKNRQIAAELVHLWEKQGVLRDKLKEHMTEYNALTQEVERLSLMVTLKTLQNKLANLLSMRKPTFLEVCQQALGSDVEPNDLVPDTLACAITVSTLIHKVDATFPKVAGTWSLYDILKHRRDWNRIDAPEPGAVIISPTGLGKAGTNGHAGIIMEDGMIASNNSVGANKGTFTKNYTLDSWKAYYGVKLKYPIFIYKKVF